jgi:hypothetical protein
MPALVRHPHSPSHAVEALEVHVVRTAERKLSLHYAVLGELARISIPAPAIRRIGWKLWRQTCCEVFLRANDAEPYHEFNFSPSGEWTAYAFTRYREGAALTDDSLDPQVVVEPRPGRLDLYALVDLPRLGAAYARGPLHVGLAAIIDEQDGGQSYWALRHAPGKPDFHHRDAFALELA